MGIKNGKLQVLPVENPFLVVVSSPADLPLLSIEEVFEEARGNPAFIPKKKFKNLCKDNEWNEFCGWKHAHRWQEFSNSVCRRIHVFFICVREETSSARLHDDQRTGKPKNYTVIKRFNRNSN